MTTASSTAPVTTTIVFDDGTTQVRRGGSRSWRNNNPANMEYGEFAQGHGAVGGDPRFAIFPDEPTGQAATLALLRLPEYQALTVAQAVGKWAPATENNTAAYQQRVEQWTHLDANTPLSTLTDQQLVSVTMAMRRQEGWIEGTVT